MSNHYQTQQQQQQQQPSHPVSSGTGSGALYSSLHQQHAYSAPQQTQQQPQHHGIDSRLGGLGSLGGLSTGLAGSGLGSQAQTQPQQTQVHQPHSQQQQSGAGGYYGRPDSYYASPQSAGLGSAANPQQSHSQQELNSPYGTQDQFGGLNSSGLSGPGHHGGGSTFASGPGEYGLYGDQQRVSTY
jgi:hypothetical protein